MIGITARKPVRGSIRESAGEKLTTSRRKVLFGLAALGAGDGVVAGLCVRREVATQERRGWLRGRRGRNGWRLPPWGRMRSVPGSCIWRDDVSSARCRPPTPTRPTLPHRTNSRAREILTQIQPIRRRRLGILND